MDWQSFAAGAWVGCAGGITLWSWFVQVKPKFEPPELPEVEPLRNPCAEIPISQMEPERFEDAVVGALTDTTRVPGDQTSYRREDGAVIVWDRPASGYAVEHYTVFWGPENLPRVVARLMVNADTPHSEVECEWEITMPSLRVREQLVERRINEQVVGNAGYRQNPANWLEDMCRRGGLTPDPAQIEYFRRIADERIAEVEGVPEAHDGPWAARRAGAIVALFDEGPEGENQAREWLAENSQRNRDGFSGTHLGQLGHGGDFIVNMEATFGAWGGNVPSVRLQTQPQSDYDYSGWQQTLDNSNGWAIIVGGECMAINGRRERAEDYLRVRYGVRDDAFVRPATDEDVAAVVSRNQQRAYDLTSPDNNVTIGYPATIPTRSYYVQGITARIYYDLPRRQYVVSFSDMINVEITLEQVTNGGYESWFNENYRAHQGESTPVLEDDLGFVASFRPDFNGAMRFPENQRQPEAVKVEKVPSAYREPRRRLEL